MFDPSKPFQSGLIFGGKAMSRPYLGAPVPQVGFGYVGVGSDLTPKYEISLGMFSSEKHPSLFALNALKH